MYNKKAIQELVDVIQSNDGIADKSKLAKIVKEQFDLTKDRSVYYCDDFAIRFSKSERKRMSNTVLSLSALQKYDRKPFVVCIVSSTTNYLLLANTTFLKKISHSSQELRTDNIKGSFNGSDIMETIDSIENAPNHFEELFAIHEGFSFEDNLERLVEATNNIVGRVSKFNVTREKREVIEKSVERAQAFIASDDYNDLNDDLSARVEKVQGEIAIAAFIDNVNLRGRIIEYLITDNGSDLKNKIINSLNNSEPLPEFVTEDKLGDYSKEYAAYVTETDIKTKVLFLAGNPKAYNIDKLLEFLSEEKSVYMIYLVGINQDKTIVAKLCSAFDERLLEATNIIHHWAGRNSRGVTQFNGKALVEILSGGNTVIDEKKALEHIRNMMER